MTRHYLTTTIPYVNAAPHLGYALEVVQADVLARHHRRRGHEVRLLSGTDDNSLKNVLAAEAAGVPVRELVDRFADRFAALTGPLSLSYDDFIRTSADPRHPAGVERLWRACAASGDLYRAEYVGRCCVGCEAYLTEDELDAYLVDGDFRRATRAVWTIVTEANRAIDRIRPWDLARAEGTATARLDGVLGVLLDACRRLTEEIAPFLPDAAARMAAQLTPVNGVLPPARPLFARLDAPRCEAP